jgi:hypothetical protein
MTICKNIILPALCLIGIIIFCPSQSDAYKIFKCNLNIYLNDSEIETNAKNINNSDLVFTVEHIESFLTITGWASDGYTCKIGKPIKGNLSDNQIELFLYHNSPESRKIQKLKSNDKLLFAFVKNGKNNSLEGFRDKSGMKWNIVFIKPIEQ